MLTHGAEALSRYERLKREAVRGGLSYGHPHSLATHDPWQDSSPNPKTILGAALLAWYRADLGVSLNGSNVSAWADQSGTGDVNKNATQGTGANQPAFNASNASYAGKPTITFTGTQIMTTGVWAVAMTQPQTRFVVAHTTAGGYFMDSLSGATQMGSLDVSGTSCNIFAGTALGSSVGTLNTPSIIISVFNGASSTIAVRQKTPQVTGNAGANGATGLTLGNTAGGGSPTAGPLAEIIIASGALSAALIASVAAYLATRYGLTEGA